SMTLSPMTRGRYHTLSGSRNATWQTRRRSGYERGRNDGEVRECDIDDVRLDDRGVADDAVHGRDEHVAEPMGLDVLTQQPVEHADRSLVERPRRGGHRQVALYAKRWSGGPAAFQPGKSGAVGTPRWERATSLKSVRKSVVTARSRPSKRCSRASPGQRP